MRYDFTYSSPPIGFRTLALFQFVVGILSALEIGATIVGFTHVDAISSFTMTSSSFGLLCLSDSVTLSLANFWIGGAKEWVSFCCKSEAVGAQKPAGPFAGAQHKCRKAALHN